MLKILNYDKFKCTADKCRFTCCEGWDVSIDEDTYNKWKKEEHKCNYILNNVKIKSCGSKREYFINKATKEVCPFLDKEGLCDVVKNNGEEYLSLTCHRFPRIENIFENTMELSLSCACPEVVELISSIDGKISMTSENPINLKSSLSELKIRETLVNIIQQENFPLEYKLIISFQMLLNILQNEKIREDYLLKELEKYKNREYIKELIDMYGEIELNLKDSVEEINYLFLDIIQNYKEVSGLKILFKEVSHFAENAKIINLSAKWQGYKSFFEQYNQLVENCIVAKILSSSVSEDIEEMTLSFQMIILEYLLVRYAVFLRYCSNKSKEIDAEELKDYIVAFSRIIGNNTEAVIEFLKDGFGEELLEIGYLCFITLF